MNCYSLHCCSTGNSALNWRICFAVNTYGPCVANKMVNGSQMTVTLHVDYLKISHKDNLEVTKFLHHFVQIYGECMTVHRGKVHDYLGMDLNFSTANTLKIGMIKYIKKIHEYFPEEIKSLADTPSSEHLFDVLEDNQNRLLPEEQTRAVHHCTAQLLFLCARVKLDIHTSVPF